MSNTIKSTANCLVKVAPYTLNGSSLSTVTYSKYAYIPDMPVFVTHLFPDGTVVTDLFQEAGALSDKFLELTDAKLKPVEKVVLDSITDSERMVTTYSMSEYLSLVGNHSQEVRVTIGGKEYIIFRTTVKLVKPIPSELFYGELGYIIAECIFSD